MFYYCIPHVSNSIYSVHTMHKFNTSLIHKIPFFYDTLNQIDDFEMFCILCVLNEWLIVVMVSNVLGHLLLIDVYACDLPTEAELFHQKDSELRLCLQMQYIECYCLAVQHFRSFVKLL